MKLSIVVNDQDIEADIHPGTLLIDFLRDNGFCSVKFSCEDGQSGSDAVLLDGRLVNSAITLAAQAHLRQVTTVEGSRRSGDISIPFNKPLLRQVPPIRICNSA